VRFKTHTCGVTTVILDCVCYSVTLFSGTGNHYGTPKPSKEPPVSPPQSSDSNTNLSSASLVLGALFPGAHPSSEGKRKRNRSNVEAMAAKNMEPEATGVYNVISDGNFSFILFVLLFLGYECSVRNSHLLAFFFIFKHFENTYHVQKHSS